jgi:hypothetical protein
MSQKFLNTDQPKFTNEIDLRGWQHFGQFGSNVTMIMEMNSNDPTYQIVLTSPNSGKEYISDKCKEVCRFGVKNTFGIFETTNHTVRYFVDIMQAKIIGSECEMAKLLIKSSGPLAQWSPNVEQYKVWFENQYKNAQGMRLESIQVKFPVDII